MAGSGLLEFVLALSGLGGWGGLPLSMPPLPPDPVIERAAPDACLLHVALAGVAKPAANASNHTEALLAEPAVRDFLSEVGSLVEDAVSGGASGTNAMPAEARSLLVALLTRPAALTIDSFALGPDGPQVEGSLVINCGPVLGEVRRAVETTMEKLQASEKDVRRREHEKDGTTWTHLGEFPSGAPDVAWGFKGNFCVIAVGTDAMEHLLERLRDKARKPPAWKVSLEKRLSIERRTLLVHADVAKAVDLALSSQPPAAAAAAINASGLGGVAALQFVGGLTKTEMASATVIDFKGEPTGLFTAGKGLVTRSDLEAIPADVTAAQIVKVDLSAALAAGLALARAVDPASAAGFSGALEQFRAVAGLDVDEHLLEPLGDTWTVFMFPSREPAAAGQAAAIVSLDDAATFAKTHRALLSLARQALAQPGAPPVALAERQAGETTIHTASLADSPMQAAWCIRGDRLLVAASADQLASMLDRVSGAPSLADVAAVRGEIGERTMTLAYQEANAAVALLEGIHSGLAPVVPIPMPRLPASEVVVRHMLPAVSVVHRDAQGDLVAESRATLPLGPLGGAGIGGGAAGTGLLVGLMLPAVQAAREAARRSTSMNNLKQIALGMLVSMEIRNRFPSAAICDKDGKPLLSWRVEILPFIDEAELYDQFRRDEPWDSEHNKKLLARMPMTYVDPGADPAEPGMTRYIVPTGAGTVFPNQSEGLRIDDISDGLSNTILCVEAEPGKAVPWTKPDDLAFDARKPLAGLENSRPEGFLAAFCDGHVQLLSGNIAADVLTALFSPAGKESVQLP